MPVLFSLPFLLLGGKSLAFPHFRKDEVKTCEYHRNGYARWLLDNNRCNNHRMVLRSASWYLIIRRPQFACPA